MTLAEKVKAFRGERSQAAVAEDLGCTHQLVSQIEKGEKPGRGLLKVILREIPMSTDERRELVAWVLGFEPADFDAALGLDDESPTEAI